jgi:phosphatidylserine/phosphatidylglycerophosphate/cardiolipin synthase-like enzyme
MKLRIAFIALSICLSFVAQAQFIKIAEARMRDTGTIVSVRGIVTNGLEIGQLIRYFQDSTAALATFYGNSNLPAFAAVKRGDSLEITGRLRYFNQLLQIDPIQSYRIINANNPVPPPLSITASGFAAANESKLVKLSNVNFINPSGTFAGNVNYNVNMGGQTVQIRIQNGSALIGKLIPTTVVNITGIMSRFNTLFQLLPRDSADIEFATIAMTQPLIQTAVTTSSLSLAWQTNIVGTTELRYGITPALGQVATNSGNRTNHTLNLTGISPATILYCQAVSTANGVTVTSPITAFVTQSLSSGEMRVYFNKSVDTLFRVGNARALATTGGRCESEIAARIQAATTTIDVAMYSTASNTVIGALKQAATRGVRVRYIHDNRATNFLLADTASLGFKVLKRPDTKLMHNKFIVIDAGDAQKSWVMGGSLNHTTGQIYEDPNNLVMIQDQALARTFTVEFEEMWGSTSAVPNPPLSKFGANKTNNTPKNHLVGGKNVEVYFSPSDNTSRALVDAVNSANTDLQVGLLILTYFELGTAINNAARRGVKVRGLVDQDTAFASSQISFLQRNGVPFRLYRAAGTNVIFHHKYAIVDASPAGINSDPLVATGSHNWTNAAENDNDENLLIIHDPIVANIYLQEFEARWREQGVALSIPENGIDQFEATVSPNPATDFIQVYLQNRKRRDISLTLFNASGQLLESIIYRNQEGEKTERIPLSHLVSGTYFVQFSTEGQVLTKKIKVIR